MTSLARQLQRLAVPQTQSALIVGKRRASLLFDPKEAANLDREAVFALGSTGLEELENIDDAFIEFEASLFNPSSQNWERSLQTKEVNDQLDATIRNFLLRLSPYFLLKSAHKSLEWLIYRYHIHQYNVEDIMQCILPYHETRIFVRMIQLLPLADPASKWHWLQAAAKGGVPVARATVVNHCVKDVGFLAFLCDMVPPFIKIHGVASSNLRSMLSFYTCTLLGALQNREEIREAMVGVMVPHILRGLKSKCGDYKAGAYMVLSQLLTQTSVQPEFLNQLLPYITKYVSVKLTKEALICLTLVFQTQPLEQLPKKCFKHLCRVPGLIPILSGLSRKYRLTPLMRVFLARLTPLAVRHASEASSCSGADSSSELSPEKVQYTDLLLGVLTDMPLDKELVIETARCLLVELANVRQGSGELELSWRTHSQVLLGQIERRYAVFFDSAVSSILCEMSDPGARQALHDVLDATTSGKKHQIVPGSSTSLMLSLNHSNESKRTLAVQHLGKMLAEGEVLPGEFAEEMLLERIGDDSFHVVHAVLSIGQPLLEVVAKDKLIEALLSMLYSAIGRKKWKKVLVMSLDLMCGANLEGCVPNLTLRLLPLLLVTQNKPANLVIPQTALQSEFASKDQLLSGIGKYWTTIRKGLNDDDQEDLKKGIGRLNCVLMKGIATALGKLPWNTALQKVTEIQSACQSDKRLSFILLVAVSVWLQQKHSADHAHKLAALILDVLTSQRTMAKRMPEEVSLETELGELLPYWTSGLEKMTTFPAGCAGWIARQVMHALQTHRTQLPETGWWSTSDPLVVILVKLLDVLMLNGCCGDSDAGKNNMWQGLTTELLQETLTAPQACQLLSLCWTLQRHESNVTCSALLQVGSLYLLAHQWKKAQAALVRENLTAQSPVLACLIMALLHPHQSMRQGALTCLGVAKEKAGKDLGPLAMLIKKLLKQKEELTADPNHVSYVLGNVFTKSGATAGLVEILMYVEDKDMPLGIKEGMLATLQHVPYQNVLKSVTPCGMNLVKAVSKDPTSATQYTCLSHILSRLDPDLAGHMTKDSAEFQLLNAALHVPLNGPLERSVQLLALSQVTRMLFENLPSVAVQQAVLTSVLDVAEHSEVSDIVNRAHRTLKQLKLDTDHISHELNIDHEEPTDGKTVKGRRRTKRTSESEKLLSWKRLTILLEALQSRKSVEKSEAMVSLLFGVLARLMKETDEEVEYRKLLVLSCMQNLTSRWVKDDIQPKQENVRMEILVECVRNSPNPQTQQQALMVMASVANFFPEYILHNVMLIFTFVGSGLLQQDDGHSFQVITHTITTVIPALLQAHQASKKGTSHLATLITNILQVFIDARNAVPRHRCLMVFHTLADTLGADSYLWMVLTLLLQSAVQGRELADLQEEGVVEGLSSSVERDLEFGVSICEQFPAGTQVQAVTQVLMFLQKLTDYHATANLSAKPPKGGKGTKVGEIDVSGLSPQQLRLLHFNLTKLIPAILTKEAFVTQVVEYMTGEVEEEPMDTDGEQKAPAPDFQAFIEQALCYIISVAKALGQLAGKPSGRFWKALLSKAYEVMDKVLYLMPLPQLLQVTSVLMKHQMASVRRKSLDMLNTKLQTLQTGKLSSEEASSLLSLVDILISLVREELQVEDSDFIACRQMALFSLKLLCKLLGASHTQEFAQLFPLCVGLMKQKSLAPPVLGSSMLCVAELCSTLKAHAIPHLNSFVPPLLKILERKQLLLENELVVTCGLTALHRLVTSLPLFLSPYLLDILTVVSEISTVVNLEDSNKKSQPALRLKAIRHQLATVLAPRVLVPALGKTFTALLQKDQSSLVSVLLMTEEHVRAIGSEDLVAQQVALTSFFCQTLDIRNQKTQLSESGLEAVEDAVVSAMMAMVVRLSESSFRPMFYKLYDWACREDTEVNKNRKLSFFKLAHRLSVKLRSLFNLFVRHMMQATSKVLDANNTLHGGEHYFGKGEVKMGKGCSLLIHVLDCLQQCMVHDVDGLFQKEVFKILLQPLVDQIENTLGGEEAFESRITNHLCPCIGQFAVAAKDDASWKSLNYQVLLKMRNTSPKVRFAALQIVEAIAQKLGEEYMVLIPETVPFLAELMEDEVEEVEQRCQQVISSMEEVLGESLQKYF